jgi:hypothetical protein
MKKTKTLTIWHMCLQSEQHNSKNFWELRKKTDICAHKRKPWPDNPNVRTGQDSLAMDPLAILLKTAQVPSVGQTTQRILNVPEG